MTSNALPTGGTGGSAHWERAHLPFSSAALVGAESTPLKASSQDSRGGLPPNDDVAAAVPAATVAAGTTHRRPTPVFAPSNPFIPTASNGNVSPIETVQVQDGGVNGVRAVWLESEVNRAQHQNLQLQHHITFLNAQMTSQLGHMRALHNKVMALESELKSLRANVANSPAAVKSGASASESVSASSSTATGDTTSATPMAHLAPPPPVNLGQDQPIPDRKRPEGTPTSADSPGFVGNYALWDLRPNSAGGSAATSVASTSTGIGESCAESPKSSAAAAAAAAAAAGPLPLCPGEISPAECPSSEQLGDVHVAPSPDSSTSTETASVGPSAELDDSTISFDDSSAAEGEDVPDIGLDITENAGELDERTSRCNHSGTAEGEDLFDTGSDVAGNGDPPVTTSKKPGHSLGDFWASSNDSVVDNSPPSRNTRNRRHGVSADDSSRRQQRRKSMSLAQEDASRRSNATTPNPSEALRTAHDNVGIKSPGAEGRGPSLAANTAKMVIQTDQDARMNTEPAASKKPLTVLPSALRRATEGREGAEDRSSHLMDCCFCQDSLPEGESIGRCDACPRSFCSQCLEHSLLEGGVRLEALDRGSRAMLEGKHGDFFIAQCPRCISGCDTNFSAPHGVPPMEHLLNELLRHDLSICFREPVDTTKHPDYIEAIGRESMMDLGTMLSKLKRKKYPRRRGPGQFMEDLNRIWRNCRKFAGCDELGKPHYGTTVPGIVRCALTLEAMQRKFCASYAVSDNQGQAWQESTWSFHRQKLERENAEARLKQLERLEDKDGDEENPCVSAIQEAGVAVGAQQKGTEDSTRRTAKARDVGGSRGPPLPQQHAETKVRDRGRKRRAPAVGKAVQEGGLKRARTRSGAGRMVMPGTSDRSSDASGTPKTVRGVARIKQEQSPWSPLDKLCDLASSFLK